MGFCSCVFIEYHHFNAARITPRYEFGFRLSYTTFEYSSLSISPIVGGLDQERALKAN